MAGREREGGDWKGRGETYIELLICWTCCGVNANAKHVS